MNRYLVGGMIRDELLGVASKDYDYTVTLDQNEVVHDDPFQIMTDQLETEGFEIFVKSPRFLTARARFPKDHPNRGVVADFVLARRESDYSDGRRPDRVEAGTLMDDLSRRDFTMNAIAKDDFGNFIDPFDGISDIQSGIIRTVGNPDERFQEDPLRILRAMRFRVTKGMGIATETDEAIDRNKDLIGTVAVERVYEEVYKMVVADQVAAFELFDDYLILQDLMDMGINFRPTLGTK